MSETRNIKTTYAVIDGNFDATLVDVTDKLWAELDQRFGDFAGSSLVSSFSFESDWPTWEVHPHGIWHTARVHAPTQMLFITPGQDTDNREEPLRRD